MYYVIYTYYIIFLNFHIAHYFCILYCISLRAFERVLGDCGPAEESLSEIREAKALDAAARYRSVELQAGTEAPNRACMHICLCVAMHIYICIYVYIYMKMYIHRCTYGYTCVFLSA